MSKKRIGLIVNPIAGMGGKVGLKGTDGADILRRAVKLGAHPEASEKAATALGALVPYKESFELLTCADDMGENSAIAAGLKPLVLDNKGRRPIEVPFDGTCKVILTSADDTERAAKEMLRQGVSLILFAGGDGTARNIYNAVKDKVPVLGIPAGVKIHSPVYATNPRNAGELAAKFMKGEAKALKEAEVMDLDEDAFREGRVTARLYGYLQVPYEERFVQNLKSGTPESEAAALDGIGDRVLEEMEPGVVYIIGPGTTTRPIMEKLGLDVTLLGVDVVKDGKLLARDAGEKRLLEILEKAKDAEIIVTVIGGQGYVFGRGNQQISPQVIRRVGKKGIRIVATRNKLNALNRRPLLVDTGDEQLDSMLSGYYRVLVAYDREVMYKIA